MYILTNLISGATRSLKSWKWILIIWFTSLFLAGLLVLPAKAAFSNVLGSSMITEKLKGGLDIEVLVDFGAHMPAILSSLSTAFFLLIIFTFLMNVFFNSGLFSSLRHSEARFGSSLFFGKAGANFWPFLLITIIMLVMIFFLALLIIGIPVMIARGSEAEGTVFGTFKTASVIFLIILPVLILVADYARAWQAASSKSECFTAIGMGFRQTFRNFFSSCLIMAVIMIIQLLFSWLVYSVVVNMKAYTGGGLILLFLVSQFLFIIKLFLRAWRYGSVTSMFEKHP
jgi:hypothetical protein